MVDTPTGSIGSIPGSTGQGVGDGREPIGGSSPLGNVHRMQVVSRTAGYGRRFPHRLLVNPTRLRWGAGLRHSLRVEKRPGCGTRGLAGPRCAPMQGEIVVKSRHRVRNEALDRPRPAFFNSLHSYAKQVLPLDLTAPASPCFSACCQTQHFGRGRIRRRPPCLAVPGFRPPSSAPTPCRRHGGGHRSGSCGGPGRRDRGLGSSLRGESCRMGRGSPRPSASRHLAHEDRRWTACASGS
jgi:hypothetical protein